MGGFTLLPVDAEKDFDVLVDICFKAFVDEPYLYVLFGLPTPENYALTKRLFQLELTADPTAQWMKVVDDDTGDLVAAAEWYVRPNFVEEKPEEVEVECWPAGSKEQANAKKIIENVHARKRKYVHEGHVCLNIMFTNPIYQRRGAGSMMLNWGCELADQLMVPMWIEASGPGRYLYQLFGFYDIEAADIKEGDFTTEYVLMRRAKKVAAIKGAKKMVVTKVAAKETEEEKKGKFEVVVVENKAHVQVDSTVFVSQKAAKAQVVSA